MAIPANRARVNVNRARTNVNRGVNRGVNNTRKYINKGTAYVKGANKIVLVLVGLFLLLIVGLCIVALSLAMMVRVHPIFFVFFLLIFIIIIFLCGVFSNIYLEIANNEEMQDVAGNLKFITNIMGKLPLFIGIFGFLLAGIMYKLRSMDQL